MLFEMKTTEFLKKAAKIGCYFVSHGKEHDYGTARKRENTSEWAGMVRKK